MHFLLVSLSFYLLEFEESSINNTACYRDKRKFCIKYATEYVPTR